MNTKLLPAILVLLFLVVACNAPNRRQVSDEDFNILLDKSKKYIQNYPHYPDSGLMVLHKLLSQQQREEKAANRGRVLNQIGSAYDTKGMYDSAAYYLYEASWIAEKIKDDSLQMSVFSNLGILQFELKNADEAIKYYRQSLAIAEKLKDSIIITHQLNNIGNAYMTLTNEFEKAVPYFEQCRDISAKIGYITAYKVAGINLAMMYNELGEHDKALQEIKHLTEQYGTNIYADFTLGEIYFKKGNYKKAIHEWKELLKKPLNTREFELSILKNIAETYKISGNPDSSVVYLEKSYNLLDSLHNQQTTETVHNLKIAYETEKKEMRITSLEDEKQLILWLGITGTIILFLGLATLFFIWRWTVQKKRLAEKQGKLAEQQRQLAEQQVKQLEQEKQLVATQAVLDGETAERTRIARDLHDGLGGMLSVVRLNLNEMKGNVTLGQNDIICFNKAFGLLDDSIEEMRRVAHHLMPDALSRFGLKTALTDFLNTVPAVEFNYFGYEQRIDRKLEVVVYRIIHELVANALKHASASHILVQVVQEADRIAFTVEDNGCGFDPEAVTCGIGLRNIRTRVSSFGGIMDMRTSVGKGTEINVELRVES